MIITIESLKIFKSKEVLHSLGSTDLHVPSYVLSVSTTFKRKEFYNIRKFKKNLDNLKSWLIENLKGFKAWVKDVF